MEKDFQTMNSKRLWDSMKIATNMKLTEKSLHVTDELAKANELNNFYKRFDNYDFSAECDMVLDSIATDDADRLEIDLKTITKVFKQVNATKATGPDGISPFLIRTCADELTSAWCVPYFPVVPVLSHCANSMENGNYYPCSRKILSTGE